MLAQLKPACVILIALTLLTGLVYPALVTGLAQLIFSPQANGSLIERDGQVIGSALIGQPFSAPGYFWGRLSATRPFPYNSAASAGSNLGPTNPALLAAAQARLAALRQADPQNRLPVPVDLVTASGSGLDGQISPAAAYYQANRVARARQIDPAQVIALIEQYAEGRQLGFLGEPRVNVLALNLALDRVAPIRQTAIESTLK